ncbi:hypothetical protein LTR33_016687, partial [Friedmanniomyces endolithicus]
YSEGVAKASIPHNVHIHTESKFTTEQLHELQPALRSSQKRPHAMTVVSPVKGMNFIMVELDSLEDLAKVTTSGVKPRAKLDEGWDTGFIGSYFYVVMPQVGQQPDTTGHQIRTRMIEGALEDAATGSAACGLCAYLSLEGRLNDRLFLITQGVEMGRKSEIGVAVTLTEDFGAIDKIELSGSAVKVMEGTVYYDWFIQSYPVHQRITIHAWATFIFLTPVVQYCYERAAQSEDNGALHSSMIQ